MTNKWYHVSYDLPESDNEDYNNLIEKIKKFSGYTNILKSSWIINSNTTSVEIRESLVKVVGKNIKIFISEIDKNYAYQLNKSDVDFLRDQLS